MLDIDARHIVASVAKSLHPSDLVIIRACVRAFNDSVSNEQRKVYTNETPSRVNM